MLDGLGTVATHAFQVWLRPDERSLGWPHPGTTMSAFAKPFDTWASMSHLVELEDWGSVGAARDARVLLQHPRRGAAPAAGADAADRTRAQAVDFLERHSRHFWPNAVDPATGGVPLGLPVRRRGRATARSASTTQYWTANTDPSDRYVQSLPGTDAYRLRPDGSGYANLVLAGDWTDCGINAGCIEAAVVSGLQAANALLGRPRWDRISGLLLR